jgi:quinoprotein glucose dehydrogenase
MHRRSYLSSVGVGVATGFAGCLSGSGSGVGGGPGVDTGSDDDADGEYRVEEVVTGLEQPWAIEHLPDDRHTLVTELVGGLRLVDRETGAVETVEGIPRVRVRGQGGLLDVAVHPSYPDEPWVYLTYAAGRADGRSTTHLGRARFDPDEPRLSEFEVLQVAQPFVKSDGHFGSRVGFDPDEHLYVTVGDRQFKNFGPDHTAQDLTTHLGTTLRLFPDGSVPPDNPFVGGEGRDEIYSYGHRNAQGIAVHPETGAVWESEFGERDGDEINIVEKGGNYGWPVADEGCTYGTGQPIGVSHEDREDVVTPVYSWPCGSGGFPPSGMDFYEGDAFPTWEGDLLVGGLASQYLARFRVDGTTVSEADSLLSGRGWRIRDVAVAPDTGYPHVVVDTANAPMVRLVPR